MSSTAVKFDSTVATQLVTALRDLGVTHVFGVPSGGWVDYMEALRRTEGIEFVLTTHEGGAGMMADVMGRMTGVPGVCFGTFGPGATNLATGVGGALLDRSPMIVLTDEMPTAMRGRVTQMGIDHQALFRPLTKKTTRLRPQRVRQTVFEAARLALSGRPGPVHIGLPVGLSAEPCPIEEVDFELPAAPEAADPAQLEEAVRLFEKARRPILALGLGAVHSAVGGKVRKLAERHGVPVVLTPMAKGLLPEEHPCYVGVLFHALSDLVGLTHAEADLVVAIGYDPVEFNYEMWLPEVPLVSLDVEPADLDQAVHELAVDVVGDINASLDALLRIPSSTDKDWDLGTLGARRSQMFERLSPQSVPVGSRFGPRAALAVLRELLPSDGIMTCDVGAHTHLIGQQWPTPAPSLQIMTNGWSTMGFGIPAAVAAKLAAPDQEVCAVVGDGGFLMTAGELVTASRCGLKIVVVLLTDNDLALIRIKQEKKGNPIYGTPVRAAGTIGSDNIFGVPVYSASSTEEFRKQLGKAFGESGPVVVEAIVDSREYDELVLKKDK